ncbi:hypothetical protein FK268_09170 [Tsukamurella sputi]|uniref:Uncharacterized protein n=1 Tax=Tsukamurella sputi TaxID=2591848 RepID=A0A5C5RRY2_9ACTN|nr:hypothetical protein [Tsukamurella sputi]TWS25352.1 hypothetical protein FK268_09170 [Tsukamurella sputi]
MSQTQTQLYKQAIDVGALAAQDLAILAKPWAKGAKAPDPLFDANGIVTGALSTFKSLGEIEQKAGAKITPDVKYNDLMGYGARAPRRKFLQSEGLSLDFTPQEVRQITKEILLNIKADAFEMTSTGGVKWTKTAGSPPRYWSLFLLAEDVNDETLDPIWQWWHLGKMSLDKPGAQSLQMDSASEAPATLTLLQDGDYLYESGIDGPGFAPIAASLGFGVTGGTFTVTVSGTPTGTYTLSIGGQTTAGIAPGATAAAVKSALAALSNVGSSKVLVSGSAGGPYAVTFSGVTGTLTADGSGLTGGSVTVA